MDYTYGINDDYLDDDDGGVMYSTRNYSSDSDDENHSLCLITPRKSRKNASIKRRKCEGSDVQDEFEREMAAELESTIKKLTASVCSSTSTNEEQKTATEPTYYDNIYFDSDESDSDEEDVSSTTQSKRKKKHRVLTNDELFYDPLMDDADQMWVDNNRRSYQVKGERSKNSKGIYKLEPLPQSDAVLNCPACFTTLCLDCQRHEVYKNQYRAMFVFNCVVDKTEVLRFSVKDDKRKKFKKNKPKENAKEALNDEAVASNCVEMSHDIQTHVAALDEPSGTDVKDEGTDDKFNPVMCSVCNTKVAVQDKSEVYHFFNALTSY